MSSPDHQTNPTPTGLPEPPSGVVSADLATDSIDPGELRALLERAREKLAFYESFDRIVGENLRRSGDLMVENVALREQAHALTAQFARERAEVEAARQADRDHYRTLVQNALDEAASLQPAISAMMGKLQDALRHIGDAPPAPTPLASPPEVAVDREDEPEPEADESILTEPVASALAPAEAIPTEPDVPGDDATPGHDAPPADAPADAGPRTIQVLAHRVPNAKTAIALQKMLRGLGVVSNVDAREFANGELRLAVTASGPLPEDTLANWLGQHAGTVTNTTECVTEVTFGD